jgi:hypothetical protein
VIFSLNSDEKIKKNLLNDLNENESVFRFLKTDRFFEMLDNKELVLVKPRKWDDPFEDFLSNTSFIDRKKVRTGFSVTKDFFGQCWTLREECDGIWRNYASLETGVRIESKAFALLREIYDITDPVAILSYFIGKVTYTKDENIRTDLCSLIRRMLGDSSGQEIAKFLLIKREEFIYEREVRLLYSKEDSATIDIVKIKIKPTRMINSILFSPKMNEHDFLKCKERLVRLYGFKSTQISKSHLYDPYTIEIEGDEL